MIHPSLCSDEANRLLALRGINQLDTPLDERFERITRLAQRLLGAPIAAISLVDSDRQWFKSIQGLNAAQTSREVSFCAHTILQEGVLVVPDARKDPRFSGNPLVRGDPHIVFYAGCPIRTSDGSRIGSLCIIDRRPRGLSLQELQLLRDLAAIAEDEFCATMQSAARDELISEVNEMSRLAQVDSLTRIWNREAIFSLLDVELARSARAETGIGVIMADLDRFKQVNDTCGHGAGDEVLRQAAKRMLGAIRTVDALGRYGGEEFMVVLGRCAGLDGACQVAQRMRERIAEGPFVTEFGEIPVTLSLGVAYGESARGIAGQKLVESADAALYSAKRGGRNRVESLLVGTANAQLATV